MAEPVTPTRPLDAVGSLKIKLGLLVGVSVMVAVVLGLIARGAGVPWWLAIPVAVALALGVTQLLAVGMVAPLRQMTQAAGQMARGDYSTRIRTGATDEVGRLAEAFNQMSADLADADRSRRELIATVSHELRTPVTALIAQLENLADGVTTPDQERLAGLHRTADDLGVLVADLLELSRLEAGAADLSLQSVALSTIVLASADEVRAAGRTLELDTQIDPDVDVLVDPRRLRQVLVNVLDNAARHHQGTGPVRVVATVNQDGWQLDISDSGPGVDPQQRELLFERFRSDAGGGTGLGLAIARWIAQLHGGSLRFVEPGVGESGARLRLNIPHPHPHAQTLTPREEPSLTITQPDPPVVTPAAPSTAASLWGAFWPEPAHLSHLRVILSAAAVGLLAGAFMAFSYPGLMWSLVLLLAGAAAFATATRRREPFTIACSLLAALLVLSLTLRDTLGLAALSVLVAAGLFLIGVAGGRTVPGFVLAGLAWPLSALRGLPWFGRSLRLTAPGASSPAVVRTVLWSALGVVLFGILFASADALFASWVDAWVPSLTFGDFVVRTFVGCAVFGLTLAAAYAALNPPRVDLHADDEPTALRNRFEWLVPVLLVDAVFALFLIAQATAVFGGHGYIERTTGLTYAEYVHQGFGQLTVATALTLVVVALAARWSGRTPRDLLWLRASLGLLCLLTLVVVVSALYRMHVYQQAYGFTVLRLTVDVFEGWLGFLVLAVMVAGVAGRGRWLPRIGVLSAGVALLGLMVINPDAWVANRNIDRYEATGKLDIYYLQNLSADAAPVIAERLPDDVATCALALLPQNQLAPNVQDDWRAWNLGRHRAAPFVDQLDFPTSEEFDLLIAAGESDPCGELATQLDQSGSFIRH